MMKVLSNRNKLGWCAAASIYLFFFVVYFPLLLATVVVLEGTPPLDLLAIKATDSLIRNCNMEPTEVVDSQFTKAADYFSKVKIKREEQANAFIYFFGITPLKLYKNQNHNIEYTDERKILQATLNFCCKKSSQMQCLTIVKYYARCSEHWFHTSFI
jgi:hypothetical protein